MFPMNVKEWEVNVKEVIWIVKVVNKEGEVFVRNAFMDWIIVLIVSVGGVGDEVERRDEGIVISI
jgi:hypothetical protein